MLNLLAGGSDWSGVEADSIPVNTSMSNPDTVPVDAVLADEAQLELTEVGVWKEKPADHETECSELDEDDGYNPNSQQYKKINSIFSNRGGLKSATKYNLWMKDEERSYVHDLYFGAVWFLMPYGAKGALGIDKRLRARAINYGWRPALNVCRKAALKVNGQLVPITCVRLSDNTDSEENMPECKHLMVKVSQPLPYSSWKNDRIPVCDECGDDILLEVDKFYYHCPAKRCPDTCGSCSKETKVDPDIALDTADTDCNVVGDDDDFDVSVCDCKDVCKGNLCRTCAVRQVNEKVSDQPPIAGLTKQQSMMSGLSKKSSAKELKLYYNTSSHKNRHHKVEELRMDDDEEEEAADVPTGNNLTDNRRMSTESMNMVAKDRSMFESLHELFGNIERDPSYYFPTLDFYILSGLKKEQSIVQSLFILLILLAQIVVPIFLIYTAGADLGYSYSGLLDMSILDYTITEINAACEEVALSELDYQSMTNAKYTKEVVCVEDANGDCTDYYCNFEVDSVCNRDTKFSRKAVGFLLILILCILTMKSFYDAANSFVFAAPSAVALAQRRQQHDNGEIDNSTRGEQSVKDIRAYWDNEKMNIFYKLQKILPLLLFECIPFYLLKGCVKLAYEFKDFIRKSCCLSRRDKAKQAADFAQGRTTSVDSRVLATIDYIYEATFNLMTHLFTSLSGSKYPPHLQMKYVVHHISHGKLPVSYDVLNFLHKIDPDLCPIHPNAVLLSIFVNFISMGLTLAASLYVTVQSKKLSDIVLNTLALQFLITLDESTLNKEEAQSAILQSCKHAKHILAGMLHVHRVTEDQQLARRRSTTFGDNKFKDRRQSLDTDLKADKKYTKSVQLANKLKHQINIEHGMYSWFNMVLYNSIVTGYYAIWEFFKPDKRRYKNLSCPFVYLRGIQDFFLTVFLYCCWIAAMVGFTFLYAWVGFFVILPVSVPVALIIATGFLTYFGVKCI